MYARILRIQTAVDQVDAASMLFEESVVPLCKNQSGFKGAQFLADRKTGSGLLITIWETEEDMLGSERSRFFQEQVAKFIGFFTAPPIREAYEVLHLDIR
jgi:heme-degrading monooxygenase HmoA